MPFVIGRVIENDQGFDEYKFGEKPYVHHTWDGAEQRARALTRKHEDSFVIFELVATTHVTIKE